METLDDLINDATDSRETKRALAVKMLQTGLSPQETATILNVSEQYISKWKIKFEKEGAAGLRLAYRGKPGYLNADQHQEMVAWIETHDTMTIEDLRNYIESQYSVIYESKQSYYDLLSEGGMSYHQTTATNPKYDEEKVMQKREEVKKVAQHQSEIDSGKIVVLFEDECHLLWGDVCGYTWGKRNQTLEVPITNQKYRQTYYGAVNFQTQAFYLKSFSSGNGENTVAYIKWLRDIYPDARLWLIWDGATYHRYAQMQAYLTEVNANLSEDQWPVTCILLAPNAPQQNPVEDIWLKGKNWLRKRFAYNKTFADVQDCFFDYLHNGVFSSAKYDWYKASPQII